MLGLLDSIESYWAFPGGHRFERARRLFDAGDFPRLARLVAAINQALVTDSYRSGASWRVAEGEDEGDDREFTAEEITPTRPYFEVLVVDDMSAEQEAALREELRKLRRPEDEFIYELVVVPSFDDAVVAALFNFNLQACVIRRRFTRHSRRDLTPLSRFVEITGDEDLMGRAPHERAQMLGDRSAGSGRRSTCTSWPRCRWRTSPGG
jgi:arginine decarboxylase